MGAVRSWLLTVIAASLICALADALMPPGAVRRVGRLVCGLVLLGAILTPLARLDLSGGQRWLEDYLASLENREAELAETVNEQMKVIIEQEYAAYIVDKTARLGLTCGIRVECGLSEEGLYLPLRVRISGALTEGERARITQIIREDLGVPEREQLYITEEDTP
jgi:stage III sporulation protein AF